MTPNKSHEIINWYVGSSMTTTNTPPLSIKVEREAEVAEVQEENEDEEICDELVHLNDDTDEDDVFGDYSCQKCNVHFTTWNMLKRHTKTVHEAIECFKCKICHKVYNSALAFQSHVVAEHGTDCDHTGDFLEKLTLYRVSRGTSFYTRVKKNHDDRRNINGSDAITTFETKSKVLSCSQCGYKSTNKRSLAIHVAKHVENGKFACKTCGRNFKKRRELTYHIRFSHREQTHICDVCGRIYRSAKTLHNHRKFAHFDGKYECKVCGRLLASQTNLDSHVAKLHIEKRTPKEEKITKNFVCDACGKVLSRSDKLRDHMRVHNGERPYVCAICKESFAKNNALKQHLLLHTDAKPYVCDICGKAFAQKPGLTAHRKSHPGQHPPLPPIYIDSILDDVLRQCEQELCKQPNGAIVDAHPSS